MVTRVGPELRAESTWFGMHPIAGSMAITLLAGLGLQLTHLIDFEARMASVVGWTLQLRFIDFGFRMVFGVLVVLIVLPFLFGYIRSRPWMRSYLGHLRFVPGHSTRLTVAVTAASGVILATLVLGFGGAFGALEIDPGAWAEDSRWFVAFLALVPGIWEELAFRGLMLTNLQRWYHRWTAILVTAVLFGFMHFTNLVLRDPSEVVFEVLMATTLGVAWGYLTVKTGSVLPAMVLHYLVNVLVDLMLESTLSDTASAAIFGSVAIVYPVLTITAVWWLARRHSVAGTASRIVASPAR